MRIKNNVIVVLFAIISMLIALSLIEAVLISPNTFPYDLPEINGEYAVISGLSFMPPAIHTNPTVDVSFNYATPINWPLISSFSLSLNDTDQTKLTSTSRSDLTYHIYHVYGTLRDVPNGIYIVAVIGDFVNGTSTKLSGGHVLRVDTNYKEPTLSVISPNQKIYHTNSIELTYTIDSKIYWSYYAIDPPSPSQANFIRFEGNTTISNLSEGPHSIRLIVQTEASRFSDHPISSQTIDFTIEKHLFR
jgi:hypothetical protein